MSLQFVTLLISMLYVQHNNENTENTNEYIEHTNELQAAILNKNYLYVVVGFGNVHFYRIHLLSTQITLEWQGLPSVSRALYSRCK